METPSSTTKRVTRSQTLLARSTTTTSNNNIPLSRKIEESEKSVSKSRTRNAKQQQDRSALIDITNDSPIVGLAMGCLQTPSSAIAKQRSSKAKTATPGSGEALLRGQVKTLLQRVEEEAELSKLSLENRPFLHLQGFVNSPNGLLAPTPANTPQVPNLSGDEGINDDSLVSVTPLPVVQEQLKICQVVSDIFNGNRQESLESQKSLTRSLMLDFSEKTETSDSSKCSSVLTYQGVEEVIVAASESKDKSPTADDDNASIWSIQVNASVHDEEEEGEIIQAEEEDYYDDDDYGEDDDVDGLVNELCEGLCNISVSNKIMANFTGKHTRFVYNEDEELVGQVECAENENSSSPSVLNLEGHANSKRGAPSVSNRGRGSGDVL